MTSNVCFVDTETTGLDPDLHQIWEVGIILPDGYEGRWFLPVDLGRADPYALKVGRFHERHPHGYDFKHNDDEYVSEVRSFCRDFAEYTRGMHLAGAVISFDEERLRRLLRANGACPEWHYHLIDVEALAAGYLSNGFDHPGDAPHRPPWDSNELSQCIGVNPEDFDRHTALGDCHWAKAIYDKTLGREVPK